MQVAEKHHTDWNRARDWLVAAAWPTLLLVICIGFFWKLVLTDQYTWLDSPDVAYRVLPSYQFQAGEWHAGRFPLWDPNDWAGQTLFGQLQRGNDVTLPDGRIIQSKEVVGPTRAGRRIVYCTDTRPCDNAIELARGATVLIHESTYASDMAEEAVQRFHATAAEAAAVAREAEVARLIITHKAPLQNRDRAGEHPFHRL